jgi:hypothetical protein
MAELKGAPENRYPVNVALLFFNPEPHTFFSEALIAKHFHVTKRTILRDIEKMKTKKTD